MRILSQSDLKRFWDKVEVRGPDECWPWKACCFDNGYGAFKMEPRMERAHRTSYFIATGDDPGVLKVLHTCDNPPCCNPGHLWKGTVADNNADRAAKGRSAKTKPNFKTRNFGEVNGSAKLSRDQVLEIRAASAADKALAARYGVSRATISDARLGRTWSWL